MPKEKSIQFQKINYNIPVLRNLVLFKCSVNFCSAGQTKCPKWLLRAHTAVTGLIRGCSRTSVKTGVETSTYFGVVLTPYDRVTGHSWCVAVNLSL